MGWADFQRAMERERVSSLAPFKELLEEELLLKDPEDELLLQDHKEKLLSKNPSEELLVKGPEEELLSKDPCEEFFPKDYFKIYGTRNTGSTIS